MSPDTLMGYGVALAVVGTGLVLVAAGIIMLKQAIRW